MQFTWSDPLQESCLSSGSVRFTVARYGQFDPYERPEASLGYVDDNDFPSQHDRAMKDSYGHLYAQQQQQYSNGNADYYGYGNRWTWRLIRLVGFDITNVLYVTTGLSRKYTGWVKKL